MMPYDVIEGRHVAGFILWLRFRDGTAGEIDLGPELHGPVFEPLRDPVVFRAFQVNPAFYKFVCRHCSGVRYNGDCE